MDPKMKIIMRYSDEILELVDNQDDYTRSDLQGRSEAIVNLIMIDYIESVQERAKEVKPNENLPTM